MTRVGRWEVLDDVGHGEGLAAAGDAHEGLVVESLACASTRRSTALGWSPVGRKSAVIWKGRSLVLTIAG